MAPAAPTAASAASKPYGASVAARNCSSSAARPRAGSKVHVATRVSRGPSDAGTMPCRFRVVGQQEFFGAEQGQLGGDSGRRAGPSELGGREVARGDIEKRQAVGG